jgi:hypothetical protein
MSGPSDNHGRQSKAASLNGTIISAGALVDSDPRLAYSDHAEAGKPQLGSDKPQNLKAVELLPHRASARESVNSKTGRQSRAGCESRDAGGPGSGRSTLNEECSLSAKFRLSYWAFCAGFRRLVARCPASWSEFSASIHSPESRTSLTGPSRGRRRPTSFSPAVMLSQQHSNKPDAPRGWHCDWKYH